LVLQALAQNYIRETELEQLRKWREIPSEWKPLP